jgi:hypothetical protein
MIISWDKWDMLTNTVYGSSSLLYTKAWSSASSFHLTSLQPVSLRSILKIFSHGKMDQTRDKQEIKSSNTMKKYNLYFSIPFAFLESSIVIFPS